MIAKSFAIGLLAALLIPAQAPAAAITQVTADASGASSFTGSANWSNLQVPTVGNTYATALLLRTPASASDFTFAGDSLTLNTSGSMGLKGAGTITVNNLILNGGKVVNSGTGGSPDTGLLAGNINVQVASAGFDGGAAGRTLNVLAAVSGTGGAQIQTLGSTVIFSANNSYANNTTINDGATLKMGVVNALPNGTGKGALTLNGGTTGATLDLNGKDTTINTLTFGTGTVLGQVINSAIGSTATLSLGGNNTTYTLSAGAIKDNTGTGGTVALTKIGTGTVTIGAAYTYSGDTTISTGTLKLGASNVLPDGTGKGNVIVNGTLDVAGRTDTINGLSGNGIVDNFSAGAVTLSVGNNDVSSSFAGAIQSTTGGLSLTKNGTGALTLTGNSTFGGAVTIKTGAVWIAHSGALGTGSKIVSVSGAGNPELHLNGTNGDVTLSSSLSFTTANTAGTVFNEAGNNAINGTILLTTGGSTLIKVNGGTLALAGNIAIASGQSSRALILDGAANGTVNGAMANGDAGDLSLTKTGNGTWTLSNANTYSGDTTVNAGALTLGASASIGNSVNISVASGAVLDVSAVSGGFTLGAGQTLKGNGTVTGTATINGTVAPGASVGTLTFSVAPTLGSGSTIIAEINQTNTQTADKIISGSGTLAYGGTLTVMNIGPVLTNGVFTLFGGGVAGSFATVNLPPGGPSHWDTANLNVNGTISFTNSAPAAQNITMGVALGDTATLQIIGGKNAPTDAESDAMTITAVGTASSGTSGFTSSAVTYTANGSLGTNTFTYTVTDALGAIDVKTVTVVVYAAEGFNRLSPPSVIGAGTVVLSYLGIPSNSYALDWTTNLTPPINWTSVATNMATGNGYLSFTNSSAEPVNFFRTRFVP